jgi:UDP-hydrolysing UDP-N-acetyl-D-glucosamine 2-epimerase
VRKVLVVVTARPSYSRVKSALRAIQAHPDLELQLVVCASAILERYGNVSQVIERDGFEIAERLYTVFEGDHPQTMAKTTGVGMIELASCFARLKPDVVVTIADRYETLATATAAAYMNIPLVHIQGGEVTGSIDDKVRNAVTQLADVHCVSTEGAGRRVADMLHDRVANLRSTVIRTGCPSIDLAARLGRVRTIDELPNANAADPLVAGVGPGLDWAKPFLIVLQHPVTDEHEDAARQAMETAEAVMWSGIQAAWFWPNVDAGSDATSKALRVFRERNPQARIHFFRNLEPDLFLRLAGGSQCIVGNSSFGIREASFLGLPAVNVGSRQQGRERGPNVMDVGHNQDDIRAAILSQMGKRYPQSHLYGDGHAGERIAEVLASMQIREERAA